MTKDVSGIYNEGSDLYYQNIGDNEYLIFSHNNPKPIWNSGFDVWIAIYSSEDLIGNSDPIKFDKVIFCYNHPRDYNLIKKFIEEE